MTAFGLINSLAFLAAAVAAGWLARDRATMRKHLPGFVATCVVFGYAFSYGSKWFLYDTVLGLDAHICEGDTVILELREPRNGDVVAALIDGETTLKRYIMDGGSPYLQAENEAYPDLIPARELIIQGVMVALLRKAA